MIKNKYLIQDDFTVIYVNSNKHGIQKVYIDTEDLSKIQKCRIYVWGTAKHTSLYARVQLPGGVAASLHRIVSNALKGQLVDHINGEALDNRKQNLRITNSIGNNQNAKKRRTARSSQYKGVHFSTKEAKWKAQIQVNGKKKALGTFISEIEAAKAYNNAALQLHKEFARINNIKDAK